MNKIKKCLLWFIGILITIITVWASTVVLAVNINKDTLTPEDVLSLDLGTDAVGKKINTYGALTLRGWHSSNYDAGVFCIQMSDHYQYRVPMTINSYVQISGNVAQLNPESKNSEHGIFSEDKANGILAYIISKGPSSKYKANLDDGGIPQHAIWYYIDKWYASSGSKLGLKNLFTRNGCSRVYSESLMREAEQYANNIGTTKTNPEVVDNTKKDKISRVLYKDSNGESYIEVGPFNYTFPGTIQDLKVQNQNDKDILSRSMKFTVRKQTTENGTSKIIREEIASSDIKSGKDFYISLKASAGIKAITNMKGKVKVPVETVYDADIWFLEAGNGQNLILVKPGKTEIPQDIEFNFDDYTVPLIGDLKIEKVDQDHPEIKLPNVEFIVQNKATGNYVYKNAETGEIEYREKRENATKFKTGDPDGKLTISGVLIGEYNFYEIANPNKGYEAEPNKAIPCSTSDTESAAYTKIANKRKYVDVEGMVWIDNTSTKVKVRNNLFKSSEADFNDITYDGKPITVRLYEQKEDGTTTLKAQSTLEDGKYKFENLEIDKIRRNKTDETDKEDEPKKYYSYYITFEYDGLIYENVTPYNQITEGEWEQSINAAIEEGIIGRNSNDINNWKASIASTKGSKAAEGTARRKELNNKFTAVEGLDNDTVKVKDQNITVDYDLDKDNRRATIKTTSGTNIIASTQGIYDIVYDEETHPTVITGINLGLYTRTQADVALTQDLQEVKVSIKGTSQIYKHGKYLTESGESVVENLDAWDNLGVQFDDYQQPVYRADIVYRDESNSQNEMEMFLTYHIALKNTSSLNSQIISIVDYFDKEFELVGIGKEINEKDRTIVNDETIRREQCEIENDTYNKYRFIFPENYINIDANKVSNIFIQFKLSREKIEQAFKTSEGDNLKEGADSITFESLAEIASYRHYKDGNLYAAVDQDAVLENAAYNDVTTFEDDTREAPGIKLTIMDPRRITGYVFEDEALKEYIEKNMRQGNGKYDNAESLIQGVQVELMEIKEDGTVNATRQKKNGEDYEYNADNEPIIENITSSTNSEGIYELDGFTPGNYIIRFTWGTENGGRNVVDYKATIYDKDTYDKESKDVHFYRNMTDAEKSMSRAIDDWNLRNIIDANTNDHSKAQYHNDITDGENGNGYNYATPVEDIQKQNMYSFTPKMTFDVEFTGEEIDAFTIIDKKLQFIVDGLNLGIIERPKQAVDISKRVSNITVKYNNEDTLINANIDENGALTGQTDYVSYIGNANDRRNALIRIELDNEILQNAYATMKYKFVITNNSEIDYSTQDFYNYGEGYENEEDIVKFAPSKVVDYLGEGSDFTVNTDNTETNKWTLKTKEQLEGIVEGIEENEANFNETKMYMTEVLKDSPIQPKESLTLEMATEKRLSSGQDANFDNEVEIVEFNKPFGRVLEFVKENAEAEQIVIPGNYIPATTKAINHETDDAKAEQIAIIPSTGADRNYIPYVVIGATALIVMAGGIYFIRRKFVK